MQHSLNPEQQQAVDTLDGPVLVLAGAGSGKTRVVTHRIVNLIKRGVYPSKILGLTFTNKAATEMKERIQHLTQSQVLICTFHSLGARILRESIHHLGYRSDFTIYDEEDINKLLKSCLGETLSAQKESMRSLKSLISKAKNGLLIPEEMVLDRADPFVARHFCGLYSQYQAKLKEYNALDYDDLLTLTVKLFKEFPEVKAIYQDRWSHLLIDEYQDTNNVQFTLVRALIEKHRNLCVVGDPDQSIYSWRGAEVQNILNFSNHFPGATVIELNQNYRSRCNILNAANALISNNGKRYEKKLWSDLGSGQKIKLHRTDTERSEAAFVGKMILQHHHDQQIPFNKMVVFYRTNAQSRAFEDLLLSCRIPYVIVGGLSFYQRREIKDLLAWLRMVYSGSDFISFTRTINLPKRGIGESTIEKLYQSAYDSNMPIFTFCEAIVDQKNPSKLSLTARHLNGLKEYVAIIRALREIARTQSVSQIVKSAIELTRYMTYLEEDRETYKERVENLNALIAKADEWEKMAEEPTLPLFLEELSLKSTLDEASSSEDCVNLMTIHHGKGLEFDITFLVGMEEDLFPHINSKDNPEALEEERRLCYVGITRAKELLYLTHVDFRFMWGVTRTQRPSRFLFEIPREYLENVGRFSR